MTQNIKGILGEDFQAGNNLHCSVRLTFISLVAEEKSLNSVKLHCLQIYMIQP